MKEYGFNLYQITFKLKELPTIGFQ